MKYAIDTFWKMTMFKNHISQMPKNTMKRVKSHSKLTNWLFLAVVKIFY